MRTSPVRVTARFLEAGLHDRSIELMKFLSGVAKRLGVGDHVYVVGGAVRNFIIEEPIKDIDVVIDSIALGGKKNSEWFAKEVIRHIPTHANLTMNPYHVAIITIGGSWVLGGEEMQGEVIEIANSRKESYSGAGGKGKGYKPDLVEPATIEEDVYRREFTFNTLLWRMSELANGPDKAEILDLTGLGKSHLKERLMITPMDPDKTFTDDPTRMLRVIKFVLKYKFKISPEVFSAVKRNAHKLKNMPWDALSPILMRDILETPKAREALVLMKSLGLIEPLAEMIQENKPFASFMAGKLTADKDVQLLLDLAGLGLGGRAVSFLTSEQQARLRELTTGKPQEEASVFLEALRQPPVDNMALIEEFSLQPRDRGVLAPEARRLILESPELHLNPAKLQERVREALSDKGYGKTAGFGDIYRVSLGVPSPMGVARRYQASFPVNPDSRAILLVNRILHNPRASKELWREIKLLGFEQAVARSSLGMDQAGLLYVDLKREKLLPEQN